MEPHTEECQSGQQVVRDIIPYAASAIWYARFLRNFKVPECEGRHAARTFIRGNASDPLMLSIAVEGGGRRLRGRNAYFNTLLSDHGNWRVTHRRALDAVYGKTPYYAHISALLNPIYEGTECTLAGFNNAIHKVLLSFLIGDMTREEILYISGGELCDETANLLPEDKISLMFDRGNEIAERIDPELSILDALMNYGRETLPGLLSLNRH